MLCVRWYLRYCLTLRDLEELMAERGLGVDHSTIGRWVLRYAPELNKRIRRDTRTPNRSWRVDETYVRVAGAWTYLYRAVDSTGETIDFMLWPKRDAVAAKHSILFAEIFNDLQLVVVHPPGDGDQQKPEWVEHSLRIQNPLSRPPSRNSELSISSSCRSSFRTIRGARMTLPPMASRFHAGFTEISHTVASQRSARQRLEAGATSYARYP